MDQPIEVWRADSNQSAGTLAALTRLLTPAEADRAGRFVFDKDRNAFVVGRGLVRQFLGRCLGRPPESVELEVTAHGKPVLSNQAKQEAIEFNVSHSARRVLVALSRGRAVGVDVELVRPLANLEELARRVFAPGEWDVFEALPDEQRQEAFFRCWVRKEAYIKGLGSGLSASLQAFEVNLAPGEPPGLVRVRHGSSGEPWSLWEIDAGNGYVAALAVPGTAAHFQCRDWQGEMS